LFAGSPPAFYRSRFFGIQLPRISWGSVFSVLPYANWRYTFAALVMLVISSVYSLVQIRSLIDYRRH
jgi:hypothetical protein